MLQFGVVWCVGVFTGRALAAQTRFEWPSDTGDVARYTTVEECLAATMRVRTWMEAWAPVWTDTLQMTPELATAPIPAAASGTARLCRERLPTAEAAPVTDFAPLLRLYLLEGRDADAATIVRRRLAVVARDAVRERVAVLDSAASGYLDVYSTRAPSAARLAAAESHLMEVARLPDSLHSVPDRLWPVFMLLINSRNAGDTARMRRAALHYAELNSRLTSADRRTPFYEASGPMYLYTALVMLQDAALRDSLRHSTASYVAAKRAAWAKASGEAPDALKFPIGERAAPIEGTFWFGRGDSTASRPTKGKVSLLVFFDYDCRNLGHGCWPAYASLHRLTQRFPAVEVTVVARTHGYFSAMAPPPPAEEANMLRRWWQEFHQVPGALAVTATDFWRLDSPDRRRIDRTTANQTHYTFGRTWPVKTPMTLLVDQRGTIVEVANLGSVGSILAADEEEHLARLIEILLTEQTAGR